MNSVVLAGNVTRDPEGRTVGETQVTKLGIAVRRRFKGKDGIDVDFFDVEVWGKPAEIVTQFVKKGNYLVVHGEVKNESWKGNDGQKKYRTVIKADNVTLGPNPNGKKAAEAPESDKGDDDNQPF